jgi:proline iminopeptidase
MGMLKTYPSFLFTEDQVVTQLFLNPRPLKSLQTKVFKTCFEVTSENGYFEMPKPTDKASKLCSSYEASDFYKTNIRNKNASIIFYKNEKLNTIDTKPILEKLKNSKLRIYAIYGKQDGIFSASQIDYIKNLAGKKTLTK